MKSEEHIEGLDVDSHFERPEDYPLDALMVRSETRAVGDVVRRIRHDRYVLNPEFQRDFVWDENKQSKLIESCVMRIPLPVFYVAEGEDGRVIVVDGQQRLTTFMRYLDNRFALQGLGDKHPLKGMRFTDLPLSIKERIEDTQLTLYILDKGAPDRARLDIFERVNSGQPLTRQQMRNAIYFGSATRWLAKAARDRTFLKATGHSLRQETMRDREAINRFCAFELIGWRHYSDMDRLLGDCLQQMNKMNDDELVRLHGKFIYSMTTNQLLFGKHAFRKSLWSPSSGRSVLNIALFDVFSVLLPRISPDVRDHHSVAIQQAARDLVRDGDFAHCITYSTNSPYQVRRRFDQAAATFEAFFSC